MLDPICIEVGVIVTLLSASFPIVTVVPDIVTRSVVSSFNFNELPVISTCSVEVLPTVVVCPNFATSAEEETTLSP